MKQNVLAVVIAAAVLTGGTVAARAAVSFAAVPPIKADQWTRWKINALLRNDIRLDYRNVKVKNRNGTVTLSGVVLTDYEKAHAVEMASDVPGVKAVKDEIMVVQYTTGPDGALAQRVRSQILQDPTMKVTALDVEAEKDGVLLHGIVSNDAIKARIGRFASEVKGVQRVDDELDVEPV